jgi:hypothetical protein
MFNLNLEIYHNILILTMLLDKKNIKLLILIIDHIWQTIRHSAEVDSLLVYLQYQDIGDTTAIRKTNSALRHLLPFL